MKKKDLERKMRQLGWFLKRQGGNHEIWSNGDIDIPIPRHKEIAEYLAIKIISKAQQHPYRKDS